MNNEEISSLKDKAYELIDNGQIADAKISFDELCDLDIDDADVWLISGSIHGDMGEIDLALSKLGKAIELQSDCIEAYINMGTLYRKAGDINKSLDCFLKTVELDPEYAEGWSQLSALHGLLGNFEDSKMMANKSIELIPEQPLVYVNLGSALQELGDSAGAIESFIKATEIDPSLSDAWFALARVYLMSGSYVHAEKISNRLLNISPAFSEAYYCLAAALQGQGKNNDAIVQYYELLQYSPDHINGKISLATLLVEKGDIEKAKEISLALKNQLSSDAISLAKLVIFLRKIGMYSDATDCLRSIIQLLPKQAGVHNDLGAALLFQGKTNEAIACFEKAIDLDAEYKPAFSNLLLSLNYVTDTGFAALFDKHKACAKKFYDVIFDSNYTSFSRNPDRQLRIGYVSPDLRNHPVGHFIEPLLRDHDTENYSIYCYSDALHIDEVGERLCSYIYSCVDTSNMNDENLISRIKSDGIDILVDLTGHCGKNRLSVFAAKPSPVQVSYLGYPNTTGLKTIDYRLTDPRADSHGKSQQFYTEKLYYLEDGFLAYMPPENIPMVTAPPSVKNKYVTFGSFNNLAKVTDDVIRQWSSILLASPNSKLLLKEKALSDDKIKADLLNRFAGHGVDAQSIKLHGWTQSIEEHMSFYNDIDIALDTFPYNGTTTTCEAIWMGVPVVTLSGNAHAGRVGASLLGQLELSNLIASTKEEYIGVACKLASNPDELSSMRTSLRAAFERSPICDCVSRTKDIENAYRTMWKNWCSQE